MAENDNNGFAALFQSMQQDYSNQDPIDRMGIAAANRQRDAYLSNKSDWDDILQSGGKLPSTSKPISFDPAEQQGINDAWNAKYTKEYNVSTQGPSGEQINEVYKFRPLSSYGPEEDASITPDMYTKIQKAYNQYGPDVLKLIFK